MSVSLLINICNIMTLNNIKDIIIKKRKLGLVLLALLPSFLSTFGGIDLQSTVQKKMATGTFYP